MQKNMKTPSSVRRSLSKLLVLSCALAACSAVAELQVTGLPDDAELKQIGEYNVLTFTNNGSFTVTVPGEVNVLVVAGGGGGGSHAGGGGGGGGVIYKTQFPVKAGEYTVTVGTGGVSNVNGGDSSVFGLRAIGGGAGASVPYKGSAGGSGGGGGGGNNGTYNKYTTYSGGAATEGQGHAGGSGTTAGNTSNAVGGGGGGAASPGGDAIITERDDTGAGTSASVYKCGNGGYGFGCFISGEMKYYGGGGGGGTQRSLYDATRGKGGFGGGGDGANGSVPGSDGEPCTGGGGGGGGRKSDTAYPGGTGGSGIVIISWGYNASTDMTAGKVSAFGGTAVWHADGTISRAFVADGQLTFAEDTEVEVLVVAGGGGGSNGSRGGGGGAGGVVYTNNLKVAAGVYDVKVGAGGDPETNGRDSAVFGLTAVGGGHGGSANLPGAAGGSGGGGGAGGGTGTESNEGGACVDGQGNIGGTGYKNGQAGGGGGAGSSGVANVGGTGVVYSVSGHAFYYGGGGNGTGNKTWVPGGGGYGFSATLGEDGEPFSGGGGGGAGALSAWTSGIAGKGGSGQVIVRYKADDFGYADTTAEAQGGAITKYSKNARRYMVHTFTESGEFVMPKWGRVSLLVVGGGGGGGSHGGGGGGAGGVLIVTNLVLSPGTYPVTIGAGGLGAGAPNANNLLSPNSGMPGGASIFANYYVPGGGYGGCVNCAGGVGASGGGGGRCYGSNNGVSNPVPAAGLGREEWGGFAGESVPYAAGDSEAYGGSGGGAGGAGTYGSGGIGVMCDFSGDEKWYGGGGGGGCRMQKDVASGGRGGGGAGGVSNESAPTDGESGTGGGGGGAGGNADNTANLNGGAGGSGIVIIRYEVLPKGTVFILR